MQDEQLEVLKQFIGATVSQTEERLRTEIQDVRVELKAEISGVEAKVDSLRQVMLDGFAGVGEAIDELHQENQIVDQRLTNLEQQAAA